MPAKRKSSGKGRVTGSKRKEINENRSSKILETESKEHTFARVVKHLGMGRVSAVVAGRSGGPTNIVVQIPKVFGRKGSTPITSSSVVTIYVGLGFNPEKDYVEGTHFQVTSILTEKQAYDLKEEGRIPSWMLSVEKTAEEAAATGDAGFEFTHGDEEEEEEEEDEDEESTSGEEVNTLHFNRKAARDYATGEFEMNFDDI